MQLTQEQRKALEKEIADHCYLDMRDRSSVNTYLCNFPHLQDLVEKIAKEALVQIITGRDEAIYVTHDDNDDIKKEIKSLREELLNDIISDIVLEVA